MVTYQKDTRENYDIRYNNDKLDGNLTIEEAKLQDGDKIVVAVIGRKNEPGQRKNNKKFSELNIRIYETFNQNKFQM